MSYPVSLLLLVSHTRLLTKMLWNFPPNCASHRAAPLCPLTSPSWPSFENIHWINVDLPVATAPYTIQYYKFMLVTTINQIWMYRYQLPEINILCLMSYVTILITVCAALLSAVSKSLASPQSWSGRRTPNEANFSRMHFVARAAFSRASSTHR